MTAPRTVLLCSALSGSLDIFKLSSYNGHASHVLAAAFLRPTCSALTMQSMGGPDCGCVINNLCLRQRASSPPAKSNTQDRYLTGHSFAYSTT